MQNDLMSEFDRSLLLIATTPSFGVAAMTELPDAERAVARTALVSS
jgi:hypothetical protein